uniref:Uncharacterized protein n=1 Tax=Romanomermis culicivorax TaxID=13658 RepID=A0A915L913_ROMCU
MRSEGGGGMLTANVPSKFCLSAAGSAFSITSTADMRLLEKNCRRMDIRKYSPSSRIKAHVT